MKVLPALTLGAIACGVVLLIHAKSVARDEKTTGTMSADLRTEPIAEFPGHELKMITVEYLPGAGTKPHRHDAYVLVYVLEGAVEMKLRGQPLRTLHAGETFVEHPGDIHEISRNASATERAKFLVIALKSSGQPLTRMVPDG